MNRLLAAFLLLVAPLMAAAQPASQPYPSRTVRIIVPFPPGGSVDLIARVVAQRLSEQMGQQFIVDNRAGANGTIGGDAVAKAAPDGHTLLVQASTHVTGPLLIQNVPYDAVRDFTAISLIGSVPLIMTVHPSVPASTLKEFIDQQRADSRRYIFGTSPIGSAGYFATEAIKHEAKLDGMLVVPYKGTAAAITDLLAGQVSALIDAIPSSYPLAKSGKLKLIAVTSAQRLPMMPDTPTVSESALPGFEMESWYGLWGPARMPRELAARIAGEVSKAVRSQLAQERLSDQGFKPVGSTPEQFSDYIGKEIARHARIIRDAHIKAQ